MGYLSIQEIYRLTDAILSGGLNTPDARDDLLSNINRGYVATLPLRSNALDQIKSDLKEMNGVPYLMGNEVPLEIWLQNGVHRLRSAFRPEQALFQQILNEVSAKSQAELAKAGAIVEKPEAPLGGLERVIHEDDLLPFGWLRGALAVGASVVRLVVTRYENGTKVNSPGREKPVMSKGTGWLIGSRHIITNHHVINARSESEPIASEADLRLQSKTAEVNFDYDFEGAEGAACAVESLEAWHPWNAPPALDYAVLKLTEPSLRRPLTLNPQSIAALRGQTMPVNIIQHPNGNPKLIGVRNNLISTLEEYELRYFTDTMRGSSGSPVCNDLWQVVALHRAEHRLGKSVNFQGKDTAWVNRGVRIDRIIDHLKANQPALWSTIGAAVI